MESLDLIDAFDDCVDRLYAGQSLQDCLRAYPQYADTLHPLLMTAQTVRAARPPIPAGAESRVRKRVMSAMRQSSAAPRWRTSARLRLVAAAMVAVVCAGLLFAWLDRKPNPPLRIVPLTTTTATTTFTPTATATVTATASASATASPAATATSSPSLTSTASASPTKTPTRTPSGTPSPTPEQVCMVTVQVSSANLRSGPGTGYVAIGVALNGESFDVLALHVSGEWVMIATPSGEGWIASSLGELSGDCTGIPLSGQELHNAPTPTSPPTGGVLPTLAPDSSAPTDDHGGGSDNAPEPTDDHGGSADDAPEPTDDHGGDSGGHSGND